MVRHQTVTWNPATQGHWPCRLPTWLSQNSGILNENHSCQGRSSGKGQRMTRARRWLVLGWQLLGPWGIHFDLHPASSQGLRAAKIHPLAGICRGAVNGIDKSQRAKFLATWPCSSCSLLTPSPYQNVVLRKSKRQEQKVSTGFCFL